MLSEEEEPIEEPGLYKQASRVLPPLIKGPGSKLFNAMIGTIKERRDPSSKNRTKSRLRQRKWRDIRLVGSTEEGNRLRAGVRSNWRGRRGGKARIARPTEANVIDPPALDDEAVFCFKWVVILEFRSNFFRSKWSPYFWESEEPAKN